MNSHRDSSDRGNDNVSKEVRKLLKNRDNDHAVLANLRGKFKDPELVSAVFDHYKERLDYIKKKAYKFKQVLFDRYSTQNLPFPKLLKKALKYTGGNKAKAARLLQIDYKTMHVKVKQLGIKFDGGDDA